MSAAAGCHRSRVYALVRRRLHPGGQAEPNPGRAVVRDAALYSCSPGADAQAGDRAAGPAGRPAGKAEASQRRDRPAGGAVQRPLLVQPDTGCASLPAADRPIGACGRGGPAAVLQAANGRRARFHRSIPVARLCRLLGSLRQARAVDPDPRPGSPGMGFRVGHRLAPARAHLLDHRGSAHGSRGAAADHRPAHRDRGQRDRLTGPTSRRDRRCRAEAAQIATVGAAQNLGGNDRAQGSVAIRFTITGTAPSSLPVDC